MGGALATCWARSTALAGVSHATRTVTMAVTRTRSASPATTAMLPRSVVTSRTETPAASNHPSKVNRCAKAGLAPESSTAIVTTTTSERILRSELPQMMIDVLVLRDAPFPAAHLSKEQVHVAVAAGLAQRMQLGEQRLEA